MPPIAVSRWRVNPRQMGSRRLPARQRDRRPGSFKITSSCAATGCFTVTPTADPHLALVRAVVAPACRHQARQPSAPPGVKIWRGKTPNPRPSPYARPLPSPRGLRSEKRETCKIPQCGYFGRVNYTPKASTPARVYVPPQVTRDFAGVRGRVQNAVAASPQSVNFSDASKQVQSFRQAPPKK
jgi:hypothetical protein